MKLEKTLRLSHDWAVSRIEHLHSRGTGDAEALQKEFMEWLDPSIESHDIYSLEYLKDRKQLE